MILALRYYVYVYCTRHQAALFSKATPQHLRKNSLSIFNKKRHTIACAVAYRQAMLIPNSPAVSQVKQSGNMYILLLLLLSSLLSLFLLGRNPKEKLEEHLTTYPSPPFLPFNMSPPLHPLRMTLIPCPCTPIPNPTGTHTHTRTIRSRTRRLQKNSRRMSRRREVRRESSRSRSPRHSPRSRTRPNHP